MALSPPKERCQQYLLLQANLLSLFDPISLFLILISPQKPLQMGKGKKKTQNKTKKLPQTPSNQATLSFCSFIFLSSFLLFSFPFSLVPLRRPHGRETKSLSSCFGLFFITSVCFLTPESRLKSLHSSFFTIARDTVPLVSADVPKVLRSPLSITSNLANAMLGHFPGNCFCLEKVIYFLFPPPSPPNVIYLSLKCCLRHLRFDETLRNPEFC